MFFVEFVMYTEKKIKGFPYLVFKHSILAFSFSFHLSFTFILEMTAPRLTLQYFLCVCEVCLTIAGAHAHKHKGDIKPIEIWFKFYFIAFIWA